MRIGKWDGKGKNHIVVDVYNNKTKCNRFYISKENVSEITKDEFKEMVKKGEICGHCYEDLSYLG